MIPTVAICFVVIIPVECARAFGGVETGRHIARDAQIATPAIIAGTPPRFSKAGLPAIALPTTIRIGTTRFAEAELEMKLVASAYYFESQRNKDEEDDSLKYRYIKMKGDASAEQIAPLEDLFELNRDTQKIEQMREDVETYEEAVRKQAALAEQARLKEQAAKAQESKAKSIKAKQEQPKNKP